MGDVNSHFWIDSELAGWPWDESLRSGNERSLDPDIDETYYWAYFAEYFSP